jgi:2-phospho-L-lactate guanylyltransferase (CobY/MobA/RfbA family)
MSDFFKRLKDRGAKPLDAAKRENFLKAVRRDVIPAIKDAEEEQRTLTAEVRSRPIKRGRLRRQDAG